MVTLVVIGLLAGAIISISPCVLPVLPVILTAAVSDRRTAEAAGDEATGDEATGDGASGGDADPEPRAPRSWRPIGVVLGLVVSFCFATLLGSIVLSALGLPQDLLRNIGIAVLALIGLSLLVPPLATLLERPFARLPQRPVNAKSNGVVLGLGLGLLFVPCAGPVLATIAVVGATHHVGFRAVVLTISLGVGVGIPLLVLAFAGDALLRRSQALRRRSRATRGVSGLVMIGLAAAIAFNLTDGLQRHVPGYTSSLQNTVENSTVAADALRNLTTHPKGAPGSSLGGACTEGASKLENCGVAPQFTGLTGWLNTPGDQPLMLSQLRGRVVLIDFWTYSCINCQRTLPHVEAWYRSYAADGLEVIGVHTPEFAFEHVVSNVRSQAASLGVKYPIAIDNDYATWNAYGNQYWPAEYLVDAQGNIRHLAFGEGDYGGTEQLIRELLSAARPGVVLPRATDVPNQTPSGEQTPETYLGYKYQPDASPGTTLAENRTQSYELPDSVEPDTFALAGTWTSRSEYLAAGSDAQLRLSYAAHDVYLVLGGTGTVTVSVNGSAARSIAVAGPPTLYPLVTGADGARATLDLHASAGVQAYDFTFG